MTVDSLDALRARDDLLAVAAAWGALHARLRPSGGTSEIRTPPASKPPIDIGISDLMRTVEDRTRFYARVLLDETDDWVPATSSMPGLLEDVAGRYGHFTHRAGARMALDFMDDAHEMRRQVSGALLSHEPPRFVGVCPEGECPGELYQRPTTTDATCRVCGRLVGPAEWRELMEVAFRDRLMTVSELVSALVVTGHYTAAETRAAAKTIRTWIYRDKLPKVVEDPDLFRFADAWNLAERRAERRTA